MKIDEINVKSDKELETLIEELQVKVRNISITLKIRESNNPAELRALRKDIARAKTIVRERQLSIREATS